MSSRELLIIKEAGVRFKQDLTESQRNLIALMWRIYFGRIEKLIVNNGAVIFNPPPRIIREHKFCSKDIPRLTGNKDNYMLKNEVCDLFVQIEAMGNGVIRALEIKYGLPFKMDFEEDDA